MPEALVLQWPPLEPDRLGSRFKWSGRIGCAVQLILLAVEIVLAVYVFLQADADMAAIKGINAGNYFSYGGVIVLLFTTVWFYRYIGVGEAIKDPTTCPTQASVLTKLWIGFWAGFVGIIFSMLLLFAAAWRLLFVLLATPQTGLMVAPNLGQDTAQSISAFDGISLISLLIVLAAELLVLGLTVQLIFKTVQPSSKTESV